MRSIFQIIGRDYGVKATVALITVSAGLFVAMLCAEKFPPFPPRAPSLETLTDFGGLVLTPRPLAETAGRMFTCIFLHAGFMHLTLNIFGLLLSGRFLERFLGPSRFFFTFMLSGLGGALFSLLLNDQAYVSVGASGGIFGLLTAAAILTRRVQEGALRQLTLQYFLPVLVSQLLPLTLYVVEKFIPLGFTLDDGIDHAAHLGGAVTGAILGFVTLKMWPAFQLKPIGERETAIMAILLFCGLLGSWLQLIFLA